MNNPRDRHSGLVPESKQKQPIIFFGNQKLVQGIKKNITPITDTLKSAGHQIIATIETKEDLDTIPALLETTPDAIAVLASFGHIVPERIISLFEPLGILNIHPSLLPKYRGSTPIESAILNGDSETGVSIMKLAKEMDAGPTYAQKSLKITPDDDKFNLATKLTTLGADTLLDVLRAPETPPTPQSGTPSYTTKLDKSMSPLDPSHKTATTLDREVRAFLGFPKSKYTFNGIQCTILKTHISDQPETPLDLKCTDGKFLSIDTLQPASKNPMSTADFLRGYSRTTK